eukprot:TRINITY_DN328_c0_g1_i12.p1 TRINITY_DN328_c0_g1~~TRINITY_DN328_c0_g1_i12.p1  ORF type:complete len:479 (-),score=59.53 TRINITY_DN328_c0_g1_i12:232-1668(-)
MLRKHPKSTNQLFFPTIIFLTAVNMRLFLVIFAIVIVCSVCQECEQILSMFSNMSADDQSKMMMMDGSVQSCMATFYTVCQGSFVLNTCCKEGSRDQCQLTKLNTTSPDFDFYTYVDAASNQCRCPFSDNSDKSVSEKLWEQVVPIRPGMRASGNTAEFSYNGDWQPAVTDVMQFFKNSTATRGEWFDVRDWANQTVQCSNNADTTTCMSCSMNMPKFALEQNVAPFGVSDMYWAYPVPGATCGMCFKVYFNPGVPSDRCNTLQFKQFPECPGIGYAPYAQYASEDWAWNARIYTEPETGRQYLIGINVEWYDLFVPLPYGISYLTKGQSPNGMGSWPIEIQATECPVGDYTIEYAFIDLNSEDSNKYNKKLQISGQSRPITSVEIKLQDGNWYSMFISGDQSDGVYPDSDGHWMSPPGVIHSMDEAVDLKITCAGSSEVIYEYGFIPNNMLCKYQDANCVRVFGQAQCPPMQNAMFE